MSGSQEVLEAEIEKLRSEIRNLKEQLDYKEGNFEEQNEDTLSRRDFIKKAGIGVAGLGTLAMTSSASAFEISSTRGINLNNDLSVNNNGNVDLKGSNILNASKIRAEDIENTRSVQINNTEVIIGHRVITSTLSVSDIEASNKIEIREGDIYQRIE